MGLSLLVMLGPPLVAAIQGGPAAWDWGLFRDWFSRGLVVLVIALLVFGPKRLPELGKSLGNGIREFKGSISGENDDAEPKASEAIASPPTAPPEAAKAAEPDAAKAPDDEPVVHDRG